LIHAFSVTSKIWAIFSPKCVNKDFLSDVVFAIRVFKGQVEFVVLIDQCAASVCGGALQGSALAVDIHRNVFGEFTCVLLSVVALIAIRHDPCHLITNNIFSISVKKIDSL
jgi:hypothetical protein